MEGLALHRGPVVLHILDFGDGTHVKALKIFGWHKPNRTLDGPPPHHVVFYFFDIDFCHGEVLGDVHLLFGDPGATQYTHGDVRRCQDSDTHLPVAT